MQALTNLSSNSRLDFRTLYSIQFSFVPKLDVTYVFCCKRESIPYSKGSFRPNSSKISKAFEKRIVHWIEDVSWGFWDVSATLEMFRLRQDSAGPWRLQRFLRGYSVHSNNFWLVSVPICLCMYVPLCWVRFTVLEVSRRVWSCSVSLQDQCSTCLSLSEIDSVMP